MRREYYRRLWADLHRHAARSSGDVALETAWLRKFNSRITCNMCRKHWRTLLADHPPELESRFAFFRWTVRAHNEINRQLGKPLVPFAQARALWSAPAFDNPSSF